MGAGSASAAENDHSCLGASKTAPNVIEKVTGAPIYVDDLTFPEAAVGKIVWPTVDHAELRRIDAEAARKLPGVVAVLTAVDVPALNGFGPAIADQPVLAEDRIRYRGDPIALVIAEDKRTAEAAARLVQVDYQPLASIHAAEDALLENAPKLFPAGNLAIEHSLAYGDIAEGEREAEVIVEGVFSTPAIEHGYLEPESGVAEWEDGRLTVYSGCQNPEAIHPLLASVLGIPQEKIRLIVPPVGGGFGGKLGISIQALLAVAACVTKRRVKITLTREESLQFTAKRHPMQLSYRMGFDHNGQLRFIDGDILANCGAYQTLSSVLVTHTVNFSTGPYRVPHVRVTGQGVFTNTPPSGAMRGFGVPQPTFAVECLMDEAAHQLGLSPIEIRRRNALRPGDRAPLGEVMTNDCYLLDTIDTVEPKYQQALKLTRDKPGWGVGFASGWKNYGEGLGRHDFAEAEVEILSSGTVEVRVGSIDIGQGVTTIMAQIAAHRLGIPYESVRVRLGDSDLHIQGGTTAGSRQTALSGNAVLQAIDDLLRQVSDRSDFTDTIGGVELIRRVQMTGKQFVGRGVFESHPTYPARSGLGDNIYFGYGFFSTVAVVHADAITGEVRVEALHSCFDVGRAINRCTIEGQLEGGAMMGIGYTLSEAYYSDEAARTTRFHDCGLPHFASLPPDMSFQLIERGDSLGPYGAKGIGEAPVVPVAPAISNAIFDALGVRMWDLPATPSKVGQALA